MNTLWTAVLVAAFFFIFYRLIRIIPEQEAWVLEQLGKYRRTLGAGLHLVIPFAQRVAYKHSLKEEAIDVPPQICITQDNVQVTVDGLLYLKVVDPAKASYGIENYRYATAQLAQTTMRSEIGRISLDHTFSEREHLNDSIVKAVDEASDAWGIKVNRYEIRDISPPDNVLEAMEKQMRAEREKRAEILKSEGEREARINQSKGEREEAINLSKGERQRRINVAQGHARAIELTAEATAQGIREIAECDPPAWRPGGHVAAGRRAVRRAARRHPRGLDHLGAASRAGRDQGRPRRVLPQARGARRSAPADRPPAGPHAAPLPEEGKA